MCIRNILNYNGHVSKDIEQLCEKMNQQPRTACVTLTDRGYFQKARQTIRDLRTYGQWQGTIVLLVVDFMPTWEEIQGFGPNVLCMPVEHIDHTALWEVWKQHPIRTQFDNSQYKKFYQWDKFYVFHPFFKTWDRILFLDAGSRVCRPITPLLQLNYKGVFISPDDSDPYDNGQRLAVQFDFDTNPEATRHFLETFGKESLQEHYFLDCIFLFDTALIDGMNTFETLKRWMIEFPISCRNDMGIVNLYFHIHKQVWFPLPQRLPDDSGYYFGWNESNYHERPSANQFIVMKYPSRPPPVL